MYQEFFGNTSVDRRGRAAIANISDANARVDLGDEFDFSAPHFTSENFNGAQQRLTSFKSKVISMMQGAPSNRTISQAQILLGRALHTLQDFYAHSNWVERNPSAPSTQVHPTIGVVGQPLNRPPRGTKTCQFCERNNCDQCDNILVQNAILTTGYYGGDDGRSGKPNGKCAHGGKVSVRRDSAGDGSISSGINKDTTNCEISPREDLHDKARNFAIEATKKYLREIRNSIGSVFTAALLAGNTQLAFVVDTTGSMGPEIASVRQQIFQIINTRISLGIPTTYILVPYNDPAIGTVTVTDDPNVFTTAVNALDAFGGGDCPEPLNKALLRAFSEIQSGGDMFLFTDARAKDSDLTFSVGTFARTSGIRLTSVFSGEFDCPLLDGSLSTLSFDTGGQFFSLGESESGMLANLGNFLAVPNQTELFSRLGTIGAVAQNFTIPVDSFLNRMILSVSGTGATNIVVRRPDNTIVQATDPNVSQISLSSGTFYSILNPAVGTWTISIAGTSGFGMNQSPDLDYITDANELNFGEPESGPSNRFEAIAPLAAAVAAAPPQSGQQFSIRVAGESTIDVTSFEFMEFADFGAHPGYRRIVGSPVPGRLTPVALTLAAAGASTAVVQFRGLDGSVLQTLNLQDVGWSDDPSEVRATGWKIYFGQVVIPSVPFHVYVTGQTTNGNAYQRVLPGVIRPQTVEISAPPIANLQPGQSMTYNMQVKNSGPADTFQLTAVDDENYLGGISPASFTLGTNETKNIKVQIKVPSNAVPLTLDTLRFTVQGTNVFNTAIVGPLMVDPIAALALGTVTATAIGGDGDAFIEPGEGASLSFQLINNGSNTASNIIAGLSSSTTGVVVSQNSSDYADIGPGASGTNLSPFIVYLPPNFSCGQTVDLRLRVSSEGNTVSEGQYHVSIPTGQAVSSSTLTRSFTGPAVSIPDNIAAGVDVPVTVSGFTGQITDLNFRIDGTNCSTTAGSTTVGISHTAASDLILKLKSPSGASINLITGTGGDGNNFCQTTLDDETSGASIQTLTSTNAPFTGTFKPDDSLSLFRGESANGIWTLNVSDTALSNSGTVRAFSLLFSGTQYSCNAAPADTTAPSCTSTGSASLTTQDTGTGLATIHVTAAENVNVTVPTFTPGTTAPVVVTGTLIDPNMNGFFEIESVDVAGNVSNCNRTITGASSASIILSDDFNDNNLNSGPLTINGDYWRTDTLLTIFTTNFNLPVAETAQHLEIGPLLVNTADAYGGVATALQYTFPAGGYSYVELGQAPSAQTHADAGFAFGNFVGYYQIRVSHGSLIGVKNIVSNETILFSIPYDPVAHRFLRIRHVSASGNVVFDTAPGNGGVPGTWTQRYSEPWNSTLGFNSFQFEMRGGTLVAEPNQPGKVIFDNFQFGTLSP